MGVTTLTLVPGLLASRTGRGDVVVMEVAGAGSDRVALFPGDHLAFTEPDSGLTVDVAVRHAADAGPPPTIDKVTAWLEERGLTVTRQDVLELLRIWNGWGEPPP